jgi:hypothetical protein
MTDWLMALRQGKIKPHHSTLPRLEQGFEGSALVYVSMIRSESVSMVHVSTYPSKPPCPYYSTAYILLLQCARVRRCVLTIIKPE